MHVSKVREHQGMHDASDIEEALLKAAEYEKMAATAKSAAERNHYERMQRKWLGIAEGWRFINDVANRY